MVFRVTVSATVTFNAYVDTEEEALDVGKRMLLKHPQGWTPEDLDREHDDVVVATDNVLAAEERKKV